MSSNLTRTISRAISRLDIRLEPKQYCKSVLEVICSSLGYDFGSMLLLDSIGGATIFSAFNLPENYSQQVNQPNVPLLSGPGGEAIKTGEPVIVNDIYNEPRLEPWHHILKGLAVETIVWIPLISKGISFGTYVLYAKQKRDISSEEVDMLIQISILFSMLLVNNEHIDDVREKSKSLEREIEERKLVGDELRKAKDIAIAANRAKSEFLTNMSHEIRTPMNAILGFAGILMEEEDEPEKREALEIIHGAGENLLELINDILDLARIETDKLDLERFNFSLAKMLETLERMFRSEADVKDLKFVVTVGPEVPGIVFGDRYKITKIIKNILKNAFKFTRTGQITVDCTYEEESNLASIKVSDTGIGIPLDKQAVIFDSFSQADASTTRKFGGTGLGLTIAGKLTMLLGGEITLQSEEGGGAQFTVTIPLPVKNTLV